MARAGSVRQGSDWEPPGEKHPPAGRVSGEQAAGLVPSRLRSSAVEARQTGSSRLRKIEHREWEERADEVSFNLDDLAANAGISLRQLERFFKGQFRKTPTVWVRELRCSRAVKLIQKGWKIGCVAKALRFASHSHFCHEFRKVYGRPPGAFAPSARRVGGVKCNRAIGKFDTGSLGTLRWA